MIRILHLSINNITTDPEGAAENLLDAVQRDRHQRIAGVCDIGQTLTIVLEDAAAGAVHYRYVFARFPDSSEDSVAAEVKVRYNAGFTTLGAFRDSDDFLWGLFALTHVE